MDSLQRVNNATLTANQYILEWNTPQNADKTLILVEGKDDREFYFRFFQNSTSEIKTSNGCGAIKEIYNILKQKIRYCIVIKDSDFARLCNIFPDENAIFYADTHDYEMMCLKNENTRREVFENLAMEYDEELCGQIFQELSYLSYFKWYNYKHHLNYRFKAFSVEGVSDTQLNDFNYIHGEILPKSTPARMVTADEIETFKQENSSCCKYELTNGHDFIKRFCHHLKTSYNTCRQETETSIRNRLHPCFRKDAFMQTHLYQSISNWENENEVTILK